MLIILEDGKEKAAKKFLTNGIWICGNWKTVNTNNLTLKFHNKIVGEIPIDVLLLKHQYTIENG